MAFSFGKPAFVTSLDHVSFVARRQARLALELCGNPPEDEDEVDDLLAWLDVRWFVVCDERGTPVADFWEVGDATVVFRIASTDVVGQVNEDRFLCHDVELWAAIAGAYDAPADVVLGADREELLERSGVQLVATLEEMARARGVAVGE